MSCDEWEFYCRTEEKREAWRGRYEEPHEEIPGQSGAIVSDRWGSCVLPCQGMCFRPTMELTAGLARR